ncbi:MAG: chitobiase/beta-hexosaminidase C-terminal domain-containing protein [Lachnospiraceae bacterium]
MKCRYCGKEIPEGELICRSCGEEVIIVPDYNPLDDMLTAQIKVHIDGEETPDYDQEEPSGRRTEGARRGTGRNTGAGSTGRNTGRSTGARGNTGRNTGRTGGTRGNTGRTGGTRGNTGRTGGTRGNIGRTARTRGYTGRNVPDDAELERERRRRQAERKKEMLRKKRRRVLIVLVILVAALIALCVVFYRNSYNGIVNQGYDALKNKEYGRAEELFSKAALKNEKKTEAYIGLSKVYLNQDKADEAEELFASVIEKQPKNAGIYEAFIEFYIEAGRQMSIPLLLDEAPDSVRSKLEDYIIEEPEYNLDDSVVYDDVQQLEISSGEDTTVYYTADGTEPSLSSMKYTGPIQLSEGENVIRAVAVDERGIPSLSVEKTYVVEFPIEDAPAVAPSTGQYESAQKIEIKVPDGYEAYYTTNGEEPTTASTKYTGPIDMPEGETLFKAVLVSSGGRVSGVTTRNYMLETETEE